MILFFDTTETFATPTFRGVKWEKIGRFLKNQQHRGIIPQIVLEETLNHIREQTSVLTQKYKEVSRKLSTLCSPQVPSSLTHRHIPYKGGEVTWRPLSESDIRLRLQQLNLSIVEYSECRLQSIVQRALHRKKPFDKNGQRGFRDAILWDTLIRVLSQSNEHCAFITRNTDDFVLDGKLAAELAAELEGLRLSGRVTIYNGIDPFISAIVDSTLQKATQVIESIRVGSYNLLDPADFLRQHIDEIEDVASASLAMGRFRLYSKFGHDVVAAKIATPVTLHNITNVDAYHTDATMLAVSLQFEVSALLEAEIAIEMFDEGIPPFYESTAVEMLFSFTSALLIDESSQSVVESTFACKDISSTREPSLSFITQAPP